MRTPTSLALLAMCGICLAACTRSTESPSAGTGTATAGSGTAATSAASGQVPLPTTPADVTAPATGIVMHPEYAKAIGRVAYVWGWPMVNMLNRSAAITQAPEPGRLNGVLPVAPRGQVGMLRRLHRPRSDLRDLSEPGCGVRSWLLLARRGASGRAGA